MLRIAAPCLGRYNTAISTRFTLFMEPPKPESPDEVMCQCSGTTRGEIQRLFSQGMTLDAISRRTGMLSGCGGCEWDILEMLRDLSKPPPHTQI